MAREARISSYPPYDLETTDEFLTMPNFGAPSTLYLKWSSYYKKTSSKMFWINLDIETRFYALLFIS